MSYPYILKTGSLREFLRKIRDQEIGIPDKLTTKDLPALGFGSSNDRPIIRILKFIEFLSADNKPTENFINFRSKEKYRRVMAQCLRNAYRELFDLYPNACQMSNEELMDFFGTKLKGGKRVIEAAVRTFKVLCEYADFESLKQITKKPIEESQIEVVEKYLPQLTLNINIQIQLPVTEDAEVYDKIFEALRRHIIFRESKAD